MLHTVGVQGMGHSDIHTPSDCLLRNECTRKNFLICEIPLTALEEKIYYLLEQLCSPITFPLSFSKLLSHHVDLHPF